MCQFSSFLQWFCWIYAIIAIKHDIPCINTRWIPRKVLKTSGCALGFQQLPRNPASVNARKNMFDPYIKYRRMITPFPVFDMRRAIRGQSFKLIFSKLLNMKIQTKYFFFNFTEYKVRLFTYRKCTLRGFQEAETVSKEPHHNNSPLQYTPNFNGCKNW